MKHRDPLAVFVLFLSGAGIAFAVISGVLCVPVMTGSAWLFYSLFAAGIILTAVLMRLTAQFLSRVARKRSPGAKVAAYYAALVLILSAGLWLRLAVLWNYPLVPASDYKIYYQLGAQLLSGQPLSQGFAEYVALFPHTLGFPLLVLLPAFRLFGPGLATALYANLGLHLGSILLTVLIGRRLGGRLCGLMAGAFMTVWPSSVFYVGLVAAEPSFTFLLLSSVWIFCVICPRESGSLAVRHPIAALALYALLGVLLALAGTIRPMAIILLMALLLVIVFPGRKKAACLRRHGARWLPASALMISYGLCAALLSSGVQALAQRPLVSGVDAAGYSLMVGVNQESVGAWNTEDSAFFFDTYYRTGSAAQAHEASLQTALSRVSADPAGTLTLALRKYQSLWQEDDFGLDWVLLFSKQQGTLTQARTALLEILHIPSRLSYLAILLLVLMCLPRLFAQPRREWLLMLLFFLGTAALHMALETQNRYHYSVIPFFLLLAGACAAKPLRLQHIWSK